MKKQKVGTSKKSVVHQKEDKAKHAEKGSTSLKTKATPVKTATSSKTPAVHQKEKSPVKFVKHGAKSTHGGIIKPFRTPAQQISGVEAVNGQKFTSLKNLDAARMKMQKFGKEEVMKV